MAKPGPKRRGALTVRLAWLREMSDLSGSVARAAARLCILVRANNETTHSAQALERRPISLNHISDSIESVDVIQDTGWGKEASMDAETLFTGFARPRDRRG